MSSAETQSYDFRALVTEMESRVRDFGFDRLGISAPSALEKDGKRLDGWLAAGFYGSMDYMRENLELRKDTRKIMPGARSVISVAKSYSGGDPDRVLDCLADGERAYISRYALGRDYHKTMKGRLKALERWLSGRLEPFGYRVFCDSAPVMEKAVAVRGGLGWIGKNSLLLHKKAGSFCFLGELFTDLPLPTRELSAKEAGDCGDCRRCIEACPTGAIVAPYQVDARRCLSYLTVENRGPIPVELRKALGNRIFGCDDCQLACPWNRFAGMHEEVDFFPRYGLESMPLTTLFAWSEEDFDRYTAGSAIRRCGYEGWLRNIAVALGNAPRGAAVVEALRRRASHGSPLVREHVAWALREQCEPEGVGR